jgi:F0F1-type ATP synthase assembly protein I
MFMLVSAATVFPLGLVAMASPLTFVLWVPLIKFSSAIGYGSFWIALALFAGLELFYFRRLKAVS